MGEAHHNVKNGNETLLPSGDMEDESNANYLHNLQSKQTLMQKLSRTVGGMPQTGYAELPSMTPYQGDSSIGELSHCLLLSNLFIPSQVNLQEDPNFFEETQLDVKVECENFGKVDQCWADRYSSTGNVWVKYSENNARAAQAAIDKLNGRWFASRPIAARFVPENIFNDNVPK